MVLAAATRGKTRGRIQIGADDPSLTAASGMLAVTELCERLGLIAALDEGMGPVKQRRARVHRRAGADRDRRDAAGRGGLAGGSGPAARRYGGAAAASSSAVPRYSWDTIRGLPLTRGGLHQVVVGSPASPLADDRRHIDDRRHMGNTPSAAPAHTVCTGQHIQHRQHQQIKTGPPRKLGLARGLPHLIEAAQDDVELAWAVKVFKDRAVEGVLHHLRHGVRRVETHVGGAGEGVRQVP